MAPACASHTCPTDGVGYHSVPLVTASTRSAYALMPPLQWYDTRTMTIIKDVAFANYKWQPQLGDHRMCVFYVSRAGQEGRRPLHGSGTAGQCYAVAAPQVLPVAALACSAWLWPMLSALPSPHPRLLTQSMTSSDEYKPMVGRAA